MVFDRIFIVITAICEVSIWWMILQDYRRERGKTELYMPGKRWVLIVILSLIPVGAVVYAKYSPINNQALKEFDASNDENLVLGYEANGVSKFCSMEVNGKALASRRSDYKLGIGCFAYDGKQDILDSPYLQVSNLYDIKDGNVYMQSQFTPYFIEYLSQVHANGVNIALLNIPNGVEPSQFTTLRQARALGVLIPNVSAARSVLQGP